MVETGYSSRKQSASAMNTAIKHKALAYRRIILERILFFYHLHQQAIFWGLRLLLAFSLLLLSLSPSVSGLTQAICLTALLILGMICFLDNEQQIDLGLQQKQGNVTRNEAGKLNTQLATKKKRKSVESVMQPVDIRQVVFEVNAFVEKKKITRKTIELFVLPNAYGTRHATKAIDQLRSAGYAIRLYTDVDSLAGIQHQQQNMIGECGGYVHIYLSH
jgi:hypothetical protein